MWFCGKCGTPITGKNIKGGKRVKKEIAVRRWKIFLSRSNKTDYETKKVSKGEFLKGEDKTIRAKNRNKKKKSAD